MSVLASAFFSLHRWRSIRTSLPMCCAVWVCACVLMSSHPISSRAIAQDSAPESAPKKPAAQNEGNATAKKSDPLDTSKPLVASNAVVESEPILYVRGKDGKLYPLLINVTPEQLDRLLKSRIDGHRVEPRYSLQQIAITGKVVGKVAELSIHMVTQISAADGVRVPLRMGRAVLKGEPKFTGEGRQYVHPSKDGSGYEWWIRAPKDSKHELKISVHVPLSKIGGEHLLRMNLPRARSSSLRLDVDAAPIIAARNDAVAVTTKPLAAGRTEVSTEKLESSFELNWHKKETATVRRLALEAEGQLLIRLNSQTVTTDASLVVSSFGTEFQTFRVALPVGAELVEAENPGLTVAAVGGKSPKGLGKMVEVSRASRSTQPMKVHLVTRLNHEAAAKNVKLPLQGFQVFTGARSAARQFGAVALHVEGDWELEWDEDRRRARRSVNDLPEPLRGDTFAVGFEYFSQPFALNIAVRKKAIRSSVESEYLVNVDDESVQLDARLDYTIHGGKQWTLSVDMGDWQLAEDAVGPANLVSGWSVNPQGLVKINLVRGSVGAVALRIKATRSAAAEESEVQFDVPSPQADTVGSAMLEIVPANNVVLTPQIDKLRDLRRQVDTDPSGGVQSKSLIYRCDAPKAHFAATRQVQPQEIDVNVLSAIHVTQDNSRVEQTFSYRVAYEAVDHVLLDVPDDVISSKQLELSLIEDGQAVPLTIPSQQTPATGQSKRIRVPLPSARIGSFRLQSRYPLAMDRLIPNASRLLPVGLIMPGSGKLKHNALSLVSPTQIHIRCLDEQWEEKPGPPMGMSELTDLRLESNQPTADIRLSIELNRPQQQTWAVINRAWIQTWLYQSKRVDRAVFNFSSNRDALALDLPGEVQSNRLEVMLDGERVESATLSGTRLVVPLPLMSEPVTRTLSVRYELPLAPARFFQHDLALIQFEDDVWLRRSYWELILPEDQYLVAGPSGWIDENRFERQGLFWLPTAARSQQQLESWAGARDTSESPKQVRRYLYSSLDASRSVVVSSLRFSMIILIASGIALLVGLIILYASWARRAGALFLIFLVAATLAMRFPSGAVLFGQAAILGLLLVGVGALLQRLLERQVVVPYAAPESSFFDRSTTEFFNDQGEQPVQGSTATASVALELSGSESKA
jgi:hypothetical protein